MLNKLQLNNLIISNKKSIQKGRIQTINKLVHKIRKLKQRQEKQQQQPENEDKFKERLRKCLEVLDQLKKVKAADLVKKILLLDKPAEIVLTNGRALPEEWAIAMLALNKIIANVINIIKSALSLEDAANASWKQELMELSKRRVKILRTEEKRLKRQQEKEQRALTRKREEWLKEQGVLEENIEGNSADSGSREAQDAINGSWQVEKLEEVHESSVNTVIEVAAKPLVTPKKEVGKNPIKKEEKHKEGSKRNNKKEESNRIVKEKPSMKRIDQPHKTTSAPLVDMPPLKRGKTTNTTKEPEVKVTHVVDDFFVTESGQPYLSTAVIIRNNEVVQPKPFEHKKRNRKDSLEDEGYSLYEPPNEEELKNLHPSWAAKLKRKPVIQGFQGKKIVFGEDQQEDHHESLIKQECKESGTKETMDPTLHPSWAAKQKLKPVIAQFQGKKITFNDDDE